MPHGVSCLPVHSGMPSPGLSASVKLASVSSVEAFLSGTPFASRSVICLPGGNINYVYRVHLVTPFEGSHTVVLKHAQPFWKTSVGTSVDVERQIFEVEAMSCVRLRLPPTSVVKVPKVHHFDGHNNIIIMEDCGVDVVTLKEFLCSSSTSSEGLAEKIGTALGDFIASLHAWSKSNPDGILDRFENSFQAKKVVVSNYDHLLAILQRLGRDDLPDFEIDTSDMLVISNLKDEYRTHLMSARVLDHDVFLMGDLWYQNVLVSTDQQSLRIYILDWELARTGLPGSDLGKFCGSLDLLIRKCRVASGPALALLRTFLDTYSNHISNCDTRLAQDTLAHWGIRHICWARRSPPDDRHLVRDLVRRGVKLLVQSRDMDFLAQSPVNGFLPK